MVRKATQIEIECENEAQIPKKEIILYWNRKAM